MGRKSLMFVASAVAILFIISGCETVPKKFKEEISGIKTKVDTIESRVEAVESKQLEVEKITTEQAQTLDEIKAARQQAVSKSNVSILDRTGSTKERTKDIQIALKKAGFYDGKIDGIKGDMTRKAIKSFQKANGLRDDGVVGPKTWDLLSGYLSGQAAAGSTGGGGESAE
jgi:peptidoglycan hydrolase-like protein with peptidoglycan-binding domain